MVDGSSDNASRERTVRTVIHRLCRLPITRWQLVNQPQAKPTSVHGRPQRPYRPNLVDFSDATTVDGRRAAVAELPPGLTSSSWIGRVAETARRLM